jgi:hypothetical protein
MEKELILKAIGYVNDIPSRVDDFFKQKDYEEIRKKWEASGDPRYFLGERPKEEKPKFKVGDWIIGKDEYFPITPSRITKIYDYRFDWDNGERIMKGVMWKHCDRGLFIRLATPQEIELHLQQVCSGKGLMKVWIKLKSPYKGTEFIFNPTATTLYYPMSDTYGNGSYTLYSQGKFAEIIPEKKKLPRTKEELFNFIFEWENRTLRPTSISILNKYLEDFED